jgi:3-methyladenine DNA glycosylase Tag
MLRLDRVADARAAGTPLTAGGVAIEPRKPTGRRSPGRGEALTAALLTPTENIAVRGQRRQPLYVAYHDDDGACRNTTTARSTRSSCSTASRPGCRGSPLRKRDNFRALSTTSSPKNRPLRWRKVEKLMQDAGIVRNRMKIEGAVLSARAYLEVMEKGPGFSAFLWDFLDGKPKINKFRDTKQVPAETALS